MTKLLEAIFDRLYLLLIMLLVPAIIGLGIGFVLPRSYQASASLWALKRYEIITATGTESDLQATPAQTQATALTELLQSRSFDIAVAKSTDLKSTFKLSQQDMGNKQALDDVYVANISKNVLVAARGTNLYEVTYTGPDARVAAQVVSAVIKEFQLQAQGFSVVEGQRLLQASQDQLVEAQKNADATAKSEATYLANHPNATLVSDPQYALLDAQREQAQATLQSIQSRIATLNQELATQSTGNETFFRTLDPPTIPEAASRSKNLITTIGVGFAVGLFACVLYILITVRRDRAFYTANDVRRTTSYAILMEVPHLTDAPNVLSAVGSARL